MIGTRLDHESGEAELWPFFSSNEFRAAVNKPLHFIGPSNLSGLADHRTRLSRLLPYPVIWKTAFYMMIGGGFVYLEWRESHFNWALLPGLMCCAGFMTVVLSLHAKKKSSNLTWWQAVIILLAIFLSPFAAVLLAKYLTK
jgi:hypothetical protein